MRTSLSVHTQLVGEGERLEAEGDERREDQVVDQLGHLAGPEGAQMDDRVREGVEDGATQVEVFGLTAHHHEQLSPQGGATPSAHRGVDDSEAAPGCVPGHADAGVGMDGRVNDHHAARVHSFEHAVGAREDFLDVGVARHADADDVTGRTELGRRRRRCGIGIGVGLEGLGAAGPQGEREAGIGDPPRHRTPLAAQSDESDPRHAFSFVRRAR
jgi:hypothetical protein